MERVEGLSYKEGLQRLGFLVERKVSRDMEEVYKGMPGIEKVGREKLSSFSLVMLELLHIQ